ncbi:spore coat protein YlbD [Bacillus sp. JJ722]|uniref:spore coat protein YlbD n=1 Tax=Bacillus sp. JJ722 TaxID=3122973 RepID=UPI002FFD881F
MSNKTQQSMEEFKVFIRNHPSLVKEVRRGIYTWQEIYEDWYLLGEQNTVWDGYRETAIAVEQVSTVKQEEEQKDMIANVFESLKNIDVQSMQKHVSNLSQALGAISGVISQFQNTAPTEEKESKVEKQPNPFDSRKD